MVAEPGRIDPLVGVWLTSADAHVAELLASAGFDYACIDLQHGLAGLADLPDLLRAVENQGARPVVRVPDAAPATIMKALDLGARAIVVPLVDDAAQAQAAVAATRYPPDGVRSFGPTRARIARGLGLLGDGPDVFVQVETATGLDEVERIAAVEGLAGIYVGPADLGLALGFDPSSSTLHDDLVPALDRIRDACGRHGLALGMHTTDARTCASQLDRGFDVVTLVVDSNLLLRAAKAELALLAELRGPTTGSR